MTSFRGGFEQLESVRLAKHKPNSGERFNDSRTSRKNLLMPVSARDFPMQVELLTTGESISRTS